MPAAKAPPDGALRVRLSFGGAADLDLYVTGPRQETVYFGNTPSQMGGTLLEDLRCDTRPPRSEVVIFERPPPGRYRVGVDFPARCGLMGRAVPFRIRVESEQLSIDETGHIRLGEFQPNVLEFER